MHCLAVRLSAGKTPRTRTLTLSKVTTAGREALVKESSFYRTTKDQPQHWECHSIHCRSFTQGGATTDVVPIHSLFLVCASLQAEAKHGTIDRSCTIPASQIARSRFPDSSCAFAAFVHCLWLAFSWLRFNVACIYVIALVAPPALSMGHSKARLTLLL